MAPSAAVGDLSRALSASSHKRHHLFRIRQPWWSRTHLCGKAVIVQAVLGLVMAVAGIPGIVRTETLRRA